MKLKILLMTLMIGMSGAEAQQIQWANKMIKYSSDLGGKQNNIKRILGKPDAFPQGGLSANAWMPKDALKGREWVEVSFANPQSVKQIAVFENVNAGCVVKIGVDPGSGNYETVWSRKVDYKTPTFKAMLPADRNYYFKRKRRKIQEAPDVLNPGIEHVILDKVVSGVVSIRVEFNFSLLPGLKQIDAIGISDSETPLEGVINTYEALESLQDAAIVPMDDLIPASALVSNDGKKLFVTMETDEKDVVYECTKISNGKWSKPSKADELLSVNDNYNYILAQYPNFILKGGKRYRQGTGETGYEFLDSSYLPIGDLKVTAFVNYDATSSASISEDAQVVIMGLESDLTQGGQDLYFASKKEDGTYSLLQNLGKSINTAAEESSPYLMSDLHTLFFCSNGFSSFGDYDIYVTYRLDDTWKKWTEPVNLGRRINSSEAEDLPSYDEKEQVLYFSTKVDGSQVIKSIKLPIQTIRDVLKK
jgi:hypothetical protein